jgi:type IV secretory pathway VirJ component
MIGQGADTPPMPVIEIPAETGNGIVTLFYSGDGGWRDLDRSVADEMAKLGHSVLGVDVLRYFWERKTPEQVTADLAATMRYYRTKWGVKSFVLAGFSFGADILPVIYNKLPESEKDNVALLVFLALGNHADFEVHVAGWLGQSTHEMPLAQELQKINKNKVLCIYGKEEKAKTSTACSSLENSGAKVIELPGGHHFDKDYPKLARMILDNYRQHGIH